MDKNTANHVAVDDGMLKMPEKIGNLGLSSIKTVIKQSPDAANGHVAIAQTRSSGREHSRFHARICNAGYGK